MDLWAGFSRLATLCKALGQSVLNCLSINAWPYRHLQSREAVLHPAVAQGTPVHLACQPLTTINTDLDSKGKPTLDASIHESKTRINPVMIEKQTLPDPRLQFQPLFLSVSHNLIAWQGSTEVNTQTRPLSIPSLRAISLAISSLLLFAEARYTIGRPKRFALWQEASLS